MSWQFRSWASKHYWSTLFTLPGDASTVYLIGVNDDKHGAVVVSRSMDQGRTWVQSPSIFHDVRYTTGERPGAGDDECGDGDISVWGICQMFLFWFLF